MNLGMLMGIRIKASEDLNDIIALNVVNGRIVGGKHPKFSFSSDIQRDAYDGIRKRLKGGESLESIRNTFA